MYIAIVRLSHDGMQMVTRIKVRKSFYGFILWLNSIYMVMPQTLLEKSVDKRVSLLLKDGRILEGKLSGFDDYMNMVITETVENGADGSGERRLGSVVLRGNNVVSISII